MGLFYYKQTGMKNTSPKQMAILIAFIASLISAITQFVMYYPMDQSHILISVFLILLIFIASYIAVYYLLNSFMFEKINPIYKTILNLNITEKELKQKLEDKDMVREVNEEVKNWADKKTKEITQLKQLAKYRKEFLGNVSHELKTPIFNIQGYVLTLLDGALEDPNINRSYLEKTEKSINRMISIVNDLEAISQLESGELQLNYSNFNLVELVNEIFESLENKAKEKGIALRLNKAYEKPIWVHADQEQIDHVITNLIVNSINYGIDYGFTEISFLEMGENILVEVSDNGIGIAKNEIPRIFERFYRVDKSRSRNSGGTGLGLAIVKHIIEAHEQTINVRSNLNEGSSFAFTLKKGIKEPK